MTTPKPRIGRLDAAIAIVAVGGAVPFMLSEVGDPIGASAWAVAPFALMFIPMLWRSSAPLLALGGMLALLLAHWAIFGELVRCGLVLPAMFLLVYAAGARLQWRDALFGLALAQAIAVAICLSDGPGAQGATPNEILFLVPVTLGVWALGRVVHAQAVLVDRLRTRTAELAATRSERARLEVATERTRLSAALDELLQRRMGELAQLAEGHAGAGGDAAVAMLAEIEARSRATLEELRTVVGALRDDGGAAPLAPEPTLTHLEALVLRAAGAHARLTIGGDPRVLPAAVELSAYRIVEHLLDGLEGPDVEVRVHFDDAALELSVTSAARRYGDEALERVHERVRLHAGTLRTTVRAGRAEAHVSLPLLVAV